MIGTTQMHRARYAEAGTLIGLILLAFALRVWILKTLTLIETDGVSYVAIAQRFQSTGSPFDPLFHPLYPLWIAVLQPFLEDYEYTGRMVSALFGAGLLVPAYLFTSALLGRPVAMLSSVLLAIHPGLVMSGASVLCEATYMFFLVSGVWMAWLSVVRRQWTLAAFAGGIFGLAYLARPEGALYFLAFLVVTVIMQVRSGASLKWMWGTLGAMFLFLLVTAPYLLYLHDTLGYWTLSGKITHVLAQDLGIAVTANQSDLSAFIAHGLSVAKQFVVNVFVWMKYVVGDLFPGALILFLLPGILAGLRDGGWKYREGVLLGAALPPFATLAFHVESRVFLPTLPFLLPLTALGVIAMARWGARETAARAWTLGLALLAIVTVLPFTLRPLVRPNIEGVLYQQAAHWIATTQPSDAILMDRKPYVAYYSGRRFVPLSSVNPEELAHAVQHTGARLLILDSRVLADRPLLFPLLYGLPPAGLELLWELDAGDTGRIRILEIRDRTLRAGARRS
jgi:4-amino-4-deoxy-L-arabinose transferase-like glycosyltransferase